MSKYLDVVNWDESSLDELPEQETDEYEYKASKISEQSPKHYKKELKEKIQKSASAFWNSGGGYFIVGYDEVIENIDGGIPDKMGNKDISDWVDKVIYEVEPVGNYKIQLIKPETENSLIDKDKVVLVIGFAESRNLPHMAHDNKYYIRAGAHSVPAKHFIVEALRAFRTHNSPVLKGLLRHHPDKKYTIELIVTTTNDVTALDVEIDFKPRIKVMMEDKKSYNLPLRIPIIDKQNPFRMDMTLIWKQANSDIWGEQDEIQLILKYKDNIGRGYKVSQALNHKKSRSAVTIGSTYIEEQNKELKDINKNLKQFINQTRWFQQFLELNILPKIQGDDSKQ